jgi:adenylate cyclase
LHTLLAPERLDFESYEHYSKGRRSLEQLGVETLEEARQHFERAVRLDPQYAMAQSGLGATYAMRYIHRTAPEDLEHAYIHLERARQIDPELAEPYPWLCYVYMRRGKLKDALEVGHRAIQLLPNLVHAHYFLGLTYFVSCEGDLGFYQRAVNHLLEAARVEPAWQATWFVLAFAAVLVGNYDRAEQFARKLLSLAGKHQVLRMVQPQFDQVLRHPCLAKYRKAKAPKGVESPSFPCSLSLECFWLLSLCPTMRPANSKSFHFVN